MSLPGLGAPTTEDATIAPVAVSRAVNLPAQSEYRFETTNPLTIKLLPPTTNSSNPNDTASAPDYPQNTAEINGTPLAPSATYTFTNAKTAVYTHHGCTLEVTGATESEYVADETNISAIANVHFALETLRDVGVARLANQRDQRDVLGGPRVLVVGPESVGKTALVKTLTAYAIRANRSPCIVNLNPHEGMLTPPGSFSAAVFGSGAVLDVEDGVNGGWGTSPVAGPTNTGVRVPVVYQYGYARVEENPEVFRSVVGRMAVAVTSRFEEDEGVKGSGIMIDMAGSVAGSGSKGMDVVDLVVSEFSINIILTLGSERLHSDLSRRYANNTTSSPDSDEAIHVVKVPTSGGAVPRTSNLTPQLKSYFFGTPSNPLSPYTQHIETSGPACPLTVWKLPSEQSTSSDTPFSNQTNSAQLSRTELTPDMSQRFLCLKHCPRESGPDVVRDASVMGFLYVLDVDVDRSRARILSPVGGRVPSCVAVMGAWPGAVDGVV
ncbi:MAG: hypothetical protein Q9159_006858 [Coniocarpon cinnabarinum]